MRTPALLSGMLFCLLGSASHAQDPIEPRASENGPVLHLKYATFDPLATLPVVPEALAHLATNELWIVQTHQAPTSALRDAITNLGGRIVSYLPDHAYVVRMKAEEVPQLGVRSDVRWLGAYEPAYRLEPLVFRELVTGSAPTRPYYAIVTEGRLDEEMLATKVRGIGGTVLNEHPGSILFEMELTPEQLVQALHFPEVLWIDRVTAKEEDMNNARIQTGADYIEAVGGYTGQGVNGHIYEGLNPSVADFNTTPVPVQSCGTSSSHGHSTATIIAGNGAANPLARGMAPDVEMHYTNYSCVTAGFSRWMVVQDLVTNHDVLFTSASWGDARTTQYTSISADADDIIFDHDIPWTQSQSNARTQDSRPQAWAKNIFSIGAIQHFDNADPSDDSWAASGASIGPAADLRIKPDLVGYYDSILTASSSGGTTQFGGTSGATPINAGANALALQMFTDFLFNNTPRVPGGTRFQNRPHFTTLKALMIANARQYPFNAASTDNRRNHQGWGFPDLRTMYNNRARMFLVDESDVLSQGQTQSYTIAVQAGDPELKVCMTFADPAGNPAATQAHINDLSLRVTSPSGTVYWGNQGLLDGNYSVAGGSADTRDTVECVFVQFPEAGNWTIEVIATEVLVDAHVETPGIDADFALCVTFGFTQPRQGQITPYGQGCVGTGQAPSSCGGNNTNGGSSTTSTFNAVYAYEYTTPQALTVTGFRLFTGTASGTVSAQTGLYLSSGGGPAATPVATSTMTVGTTVQFYESTFATPISIPAGATFYVTCDHASVYRADLSSGTPGRSFYRSGTSWLLSGFVDITSFQIACPGGSGAVPEFTLDGLPEVGAQLDYDLRYAAANRTAFLVVGLSDQNWLGLPLPYDMASLGAPGCSILTSLDVLLPLTTDGNGNASLQVTIPGDPALVGGLLYHQYAVDDPTANTLGIVVSNGNELSLGG